MPESSSIPVIPRLGRLDSLITYLEEKQNSTSWSSNISTQGAGKQCMSLDLAIREMKDKGSILDRVNSLENRLFQLCLEIEASSASSSSTSQTSEIMSSKNGNNNNTNQSFSFGSLDEPNHRYDENQRLSFHRALVDRFNFLGNSLDHGMNNFTQLKHVFARTEDGADTCKTGKKRKICRRRWKRLLGC